MLAAPACVEHVPHHPPVPPFHHSLKLVALAGQHFLSAVVNDAAALARRRAGAPGKKARDVERRLVLSAEDVAAALRDVRRPPAGGGGRDKTGGCMHAPFWRSLQAAERGSARLPRKPCATTAPGRGHQRPSRSPAWSPRPPRRLPLARCQGPPLRCPPPLRPQYGVNVRPAPYYVNPTRR